MSSGLSDNPILRSSGIPAYAAIRAFHVEPGIKEMLNRAGKLLENAEEELERGWDELMSPLEQIEQLYEYGWNSVEHLLSVVNNEELRRAHESVLPQVVQFGLRVGQSRPIYERMTAIRSSDAWNELSECRQRILTEAIRNAEFSGIGLTGTERDQFNKNQQRLSQLATEFSNHVLDATKTFRLDITEPHDVEGLPKTLRRLASAAWSQANENEGKESSPESGPWRVTLDAPSFGPFLQHCRNRDYRERVYRAWIFRASSGETNNLTVHPNGWPHRLGRAWEPRQ